MKAHRTSFEVDRDLCFGSVDDDDADAAVGDSLVSECARVSSLGVVMGESKGDLGESGKSERCAGVFCGFCGGGNDLSWSFYFFLPLMLRQGGRLGLCFCFLVWSLYMFLLPLPSY